MGWKLYQLSSIARTAGRKLLATLPLRVSVSGVCAAVIRSTYLWTNPNDFAVGIDVDTSLALIG